MFKRIYTLLFCLFLLFNSFNLVAFADTQSNVPDGYSPCGLNDQVDAFKAYCQSRNLVIEGSGLDAVTSFLTNAYQGSVSKVGLDINQLQNEIYKRTSDNLGAQWFFTSTGIAAYNRIFAELLQNNDLEVGDNVNDKNVYSGYYSPANNVGVFSIVDSTYSYTESSSVVYYGAYWHYSASQLNSMFTPEQTGSVYLNMPAVFGVSTPSNYRLSNDYGTGDTVQVLDGRSVMGQVRLEGVKTNGYPSLIYDRATDRYYTGFVQPNASRHYYTWQRLYLSGNNQLVSVNINFTTNNNTINNNNYEGDTYITNEGDVITNEQPGGTDPGWNVGGGQGSYDDGNGNSYTINFPDFELPDLNIDWSIKGLGNKFPFSIPFDIASLVTVLNAEPEAPRFQGTVNFGFTTWDYDINLQQFDSVAHACRIAELLLLVFGLILITRSIIKG